MVQVWQDGLGNGEEWEEISFFIASGLAGAAL